MYVWVLILWGPWVAPFYAGEYCFACYDNCEASAQVQVIALRGVYGPGKLRWRCELRRHEGE